MAAHFISGIPVDRTVSDNGIISVNLSNIKYISEDDKTRAIIMFDKGYGITVNLSYQELMNEIGNHNKTDE